MYSQLKTYKTDATRKGTASLPVRKHDLVVSAISMLSDREIRLMSREDLLAALRMAQSSWPKSEERNVHDMDVAALRRLLAIVREYFRKEMHGQSVRANWSPEFN